MISYIQMHRDAAMEPAEAALTFLKRKEYFSQTGIPQALPRGKDCLWSCQ